MLVVSAGMQKSGSAYIYNVINDIMEAAGNSDARQIKSRYKLDHVMKQYNNSIALSYSNLLRLASIARREGSFAVKTHQRPNVLLRLMLALGQVKVIYVYRDPRDVMLSAMDHGKRIIERGEKHGFAQMTDFDSALNNVRRWCIVGRSYWRLRGAISVSYEQLMHHPLDVVGRLMDYLGLKVDAVVVKAILDRYSRDHVSDPDLRSALHLNKAETDRYVREMTGEQTKRVNAELGWFIEEAGYSLGAFGGSEPGRG